MPSTLLLCMCCLHTYVMSLCCCFCFCFCSVAFRWLLNAEEYVPHQDLTQVRASVVQVSARIIGVMSRIQLADVTAAFTQKLEERVNPQARKEAAAPRADANLLRAQTLKLCAGGSRCGCDWWQGHVCVRKKWAKQ